MPSFLQRYIEHFVVTDSWADQGRRKKIRAPGQRHDTGPLGTKI